MQECIIKQQKQQEFTCTSTCLAMILGIDQKIVIDEFHDSYYKNHDLLPWEYLGIKGLSCKKHYSHENHKTLEADRIYLLTVSSLNIEGGLHHIIAQTVYEDGEIRWYVFDPNKDYLGRHYYTTIGSWVPELSVSVEDVLRWRRVNL